MMRQQWARILGGTLALGLAAATLTGCGGRRDDATTDDADAPVTCEVKTDTRISIATGNSTGVYFAIGNAYATQVSAATGGKVKATAAETGASVQNIQQLVRGDYQVAFSLADTAADAVDGQGAFDGKPQPIRALARIHTNYTQVIARTGTGITKVEDLKGKRVSTGSPKSGTEVIANRLLESAGLDPAKDVRAQRLDLAKTVDGMKSGSIDAMVWSGGLPTPGITDLFTTAKNRVTFLDITPLLPAMQKISGEYEQASIPAATYGTPAAVPTIAVPNLLLVPESLDADLACVLTKTLFEKQPALVAANKAAKDISLDTAGRTEPVKLHRGAEKALADLQ
ncbi:TAXI family TRAP transporter solute-binding subunit [Cryptosporangium japonicum]